MADRIEREIEEILRKIDDFVPERPRRAPRKRPAPQPAPANPSRANRGLARISLNQVMFWSLVAVVVGFFFGALPFSGWLMLGGLIVFVSAFLLSRMSAGSGGRQAEKRWRGETLDLSEPGLPDRIKAWIKGRRRRPV